MTKHENPNRPAKTYFLTILGLGILLFFVTVANGTFHAWVTAQTAGQSLEVSPPSQEVTVDPGKSVTITAKIRNDTTNALPMSVHIEDFTATGEEGQVALTTEGTKWSVVSWTNVSPSKFQLGPGAEKEVTATITVPKNAAGGRYGSFVFGVDAKAKGNGAALSQQIASLFLLRITAPVNESLALKSFSAPKLSEFGPIPFSLDFANTGNVHVKTYGLINVTDMFGKKVADIVVTGTNVFPQAERVIHARLNKSFLIGSYTATAIMYYGSVQNQTITAQTSFFVFPTRLAAILLVIVLILYMMRRRLGKALGALMGK